MVAAQESWAERCAAVLVVDVVIVAVDGGGDRDHRLQRRRPRAATCRQLKPPQEMPIMPTEPFDQGWAAIQAISSQALASSSGCIFAVDHAIGSRPEPRISTRTPAMPAAAKTG